MPSIAVRGRAAFVGRVSVHPFSGPSLASFNSASRTCQLPSRDPALRPNHRHALARVSGPAVSLRAIITFQLLGYNTKTGRQVEQREVRNETRAHHLFS